MGFAWRYSGRHVTTRGDPSFVELQQDLGGHSVQGPTSVGDASVSEPRGHQWTLTVAVGDADLMHFVGVFDKHCVARAAVAVGLVIIPRGSRLTPLPGPSTKEVSLYRTSHTDDTWSCGRGAFNLLHWAAHLCADVSSVFGRLPCGREWLVVGLSTL